MEEVIERLNNTLSAKKNSWPVTIKGRVRNPDGSFVYSLNDPLELSDDGTYLVWLWSFTGWSNFPNVLEGENDLFFYQRDGGILDQIRVPTSLHSVITYNAYIQNKLGSKEIEFSYDLTTQRILLTVAKGFWVYFDRPQTWRDRLGFESGVYGEGVHVAGNQADILQTLNIFIETDISYGWSFEGNKTNILYSIVNSSPAGSMIIEKPNPPVKVILNKRHISSIRVRFLSDDNLPVTFQGEEFVLNLVIERL